jgi:GNAT superfamily N-acetyltransferase
LSPLEIEELGPDQLDRARPLWFVLHEHHLALGSPREIMATPRTSEESWRFRQEAVRSWVREEDGFALLATRDGEPVGFAVARTQQSPGTWDIGERLGVLDILVVSPEERGRGTGRALMEEVRVRLRRTGVQVVAIDVLENNREAIDFYATAGAVEATRSYWLPLDG